jgi:elongation factor P
MGKMNDINMGSVLEWENGLYVVTDKQHQKMAMRGARLWVKMRNIVTGKVLEHTFSPTEDVTLARIEKQDMQFLYRAGDMFTFMHMVTFDQPELHGDTLGPDVVKWLSEEMIVTFHMNGEDVVFVEVPEHIEIEVTEALPHAKGDTAGAELRGVMCAGGVEIQAPPFIKTGDKIKVSTKTGQYISRVN